MLGSTIPVSIIGIRYAMSVEPFWKPEQYSVSRVERSIRAQRLNIALVPVVGMLCGSTISGIVVAVSYVLKEL